MKIEELISGKGDQKEIRLEWASIPVSVLKSLMEDGYVHIKPYKENKTFSLWGKTCSACFTEQELRQRQ